MTHLDNVDIILDIQLPLPGEGVQIPEQRRVIGGGQCVSARGMDGQGVDRC